MALVPRKRQRWPKCPQSHFPLDLCHLPAEIFDCSDKNTIFLGDLNAKHQSWGCSTNNDRVNDLLNAAGDRALIFLNSGLPTHTSFSYARCKKPHTIAEELILPAAIEIVETMFGDDFAKELQSIPLSNDTVSRRIDDISEDVEQQLFGKLRDKLFSIQLDEATDSNKDAHFIAYVRFWDGISAVEELLFCKPIKLKATAIALFDILNNFINEANIEWKNCVGICTDGARTMSGRFKSIQALVKQKSPLCIWTHCMIHRESLASKEISPGLNIVLMTVVTVVNYIKMRSLLFYCEARWLSRRKFLQRVYELRNEITIFLEKENLPEAEKFRDGLFLMKLSYLVDIFEKLNILNLQLQGSNVHMFYTSDKINAFCRKLELWSRNLKQKPRNV
ncbi:zinc finger MYM-type protein 6 [Trichonephila clavipes]|nr:zinc finger MYM-type protein 6 [Trichonephila clavipes]